MGVRPCFTDRECPIQGYAQLKFFPSQSDSSLASSSDKFGTVRVTVELPFVVDISNFECVPPMLPYLPVVQDCCKLHDDSSCGLTPVVHRRVWRWTSDEPAVDCSEDSPILLKLSTSIFHKLCKSGDGFSEDSSDLGSKFFIAS